MQIPVGGARLYEVTADQRCYCYCVSSSQPGQRDKQAHALSLCYPGLTGVPMETIFDHAPTKDELRYLTGPFGREWYLDGLTEDRALEDLCMLFAMRNDEARSVAYARKMSDQDYVRFNLLNYDLIPDRLIRKSRSSADKESKAA